jgi:hypothetical protein
VSGPTAVCALVLEGDHTFTAKKGCEARIDSLKPKKGLRRLQMGAREKIPSTGLREKKEKAKGDNAKAAATAIRDAELERRAVRDAKAAEVKAKAAAEAAAAKAKAAAAPAP